MGRNGALGPSPWLFPTDLGDAVAAMRGGGTAVGGGAALASAAFAFGIDNLAVDLHGLGLDSLAPPRIGAMVSLDALTDNAELSAGWPAVVAAARVTANPGVRRLATVGGTVAARLPTADLPTALCAYRSSVETTDDGSTFVTRLLEDYLRGEPDGALVTAIILGPPLPGTYRRLAGRPGPAPAIAAIAAVRDGDAVSYWAGAVGRCPRPYTPAAPPDQSELLDDARASAWYRRRVLAVLAADARDELE